jgi:hypothetical protein
VAPNALPVRRCSHHNLPGPHQTEPPLPHGYWAGQYFRSRVADITTSLGRPALVIARINKGGIVSRRVGLVAAALGLIAFALGYVLHPM